MNKRSWDLIQYFEYAHLKPELQKISKPLGELALTLDALLPDNPEKEMGLRKLLEAKDCFVRASIYKSAPSGDRRD